MKAKVQIIKVGYTKSGKVQITVKGKDVAKLAKFDQDFKTEHDKEYAVLYNVTDTTAQIALSDNLVAGICRSNGLKVIRPDVIRGSVATIELEPRIKGDIVNDVEIGTTHLGLNIICDINEDRLDKALDKQFDKEYELKATTKTVVSIDLDDDEPKVEPQLEVKSTKSKK